MLLFSGSQLIISFNFMGKVLEAGLGLIEHSDHLLQLLHGWKPAWALEAGLGLNTQIISFNFFMVGSRLELEHSDHLLQLLHGLLSRQHAIQFAPMSPPRCLVLSFFTFNGNPEHLLELSANVPYSDGCPSLCAKTNRAIFMLKPNQSGFRSC